MQSSKETYDQIAAYLLGELDGDALMSFESKMASDVEFRQEVELHNSLSKHLSNDVEKSFLNNISQLSSKHKSKHKPRNKKWMWFVVIGAFTLMAVLGQKYLFDQPSLEPEKVEKKDNDSELKKEKSEEINASKSKYDTDKLIEPEKAEKTAVKKPTAVDRKIPVKTNKVKQRQPLAMVDFNPNKSLDLLINGTTRGLVRDFTVLDNIKDQKYNLNIPVQILFSGTIDTSSNLVDEDLTLYIFSNKVEDYDSFKPVNTSNPILKKVDSGYKLVVDKKINLKPGLYYYILETTDEEELIYIEKFSVK